MCKFYGTAPFNLLSSYLVFAQILTEDHSKFLQTQFPSALDLAPG